MAIVLALPKFYADVKAIVEASTPAVQFAFGWREPSKNVEGIGTARIVFAPGDVGGALGEDLPPRNPGRNPRPIATLGELFRVYVTAYDPSAPRDELVQYKAARVLFDEWRRAAHVAAHGTFKVESLAWNVAKTEGRFGAEIIATCSIESMIPDSAAGEQTAVSARVTEQTQGVTAVFYAPVPPPPPEGD